MADLDAALIEREFHGVGEIREGEAAVEFGLGPAEPPRRLGAIILAGGENPNGGVRLLRLRRIVAIVVLVDRRFQRFLVGHLADDDGHLPFWTESLEGGPIPAASRDNDVGVVDVGCRAEKHRLKHAAQPERRDQVLVLLSVEIATWIVSKHDLGERQRRGCIRMRWGQGGSPSGLASRLLRGCAPSFRRA